MPLGVETLLKYEGNQNVVDEYNECILLLVHVFSQIMSDVGVPFLQRKDATLHQEHSQL